MKLKNTGNMDLKGLTICVTGGAGFVGSHTAKTLKAAGARVIVLDRRRLPLPDTIYDQFLHDDFAEERVLDYLQGMNVDGFVHCAGTSLVGPSIKNPSEYYNNNVLKNIQLLDHLKEWKIKPFIVFSSSAATYGNPVNIPIQETDPQIPINPYGESKLVMEHLLRDYGNAYGIRSLSLRYFNACGADVWGSELGPEEGDTHIIPRLFTDSPFCLFGDDYSTPDGTCVRDYIHVSDLAIAHGKACLALSDGHESGCYNLGTNKGYSNQELVEAYRKHVGDLTVLTGPRREGDPDELVADASAFMKEFHWKPAFSDLETIIKSTADWYNRGV
jgi:UDP-glucose 4-epimerase